jgi:hypothetical protein
LIFSLYLFEDGNFDSGSCVCDLGNFDYGSLVCHIHLSDGYLDFSLFPSDLFLFLFLFLSLC